MAGKNMRFRAKKKGAICELIAPMRSNQITGITRNDSNVDVIYIVDKCSTRYLYSLFNLTRSIWFGQKEKNNIWIKETKPNETSRNTTYEICKP